MVIISQNSIKQLIIIMETNCVLFEVRAEFLNTVLFQQALGFRGLIPFTAFHSHYSWWPVVCQTVKSAFNS